jgi:hypothetical protein
VPLDGQIVGENLLRSTLLKITTPKPAGDGSYQQYVKLFETLPFENLL